MRTGPVHSPGHTSCTYREEATLGCEIKILLRGLSIRKVVCDWVLRLFTSFLSSLFKHGEAASYSKPKFLPGNVLFWRFAIVLRLDRDLGGAGRLGMICSTHEGGSRTFSPFSLATVHFSAYRGSLSKKTGERANTEKSSWHISLYLTVLDFCWTKKLDWRRNKLCPRIKGRVS